MKVEKKADKSPYNPKFVAKIKCGEADVKAGRTIKVKLDEIWT